MLKIRFLVKRWRQDTYREMGITEAKEEQKEAEQESHNAVRRSCERRGESSWGGTGSAPLSTTENQQTGVVPAS